MPIDVALLGCAHHHVPDVLGVFASESGIAHFAHLGGMAGGWLLLRRWGLRARLGS